MTKAMIITVGGTIEPIIKSIDEHKPDFVSFLASQETVDKIAEIKGRIQIKVPCEITLVDNVNELLHCHEKAEEAVQRALKKNYKGQDVVVDYTGGTKNMSAALSLAAIAHGFVFSYVGGIERSKGGVGIVINGCEQVYSSVNPWDFLAVEERKKISLLFNAYQFSAAGTLVDSILEKTTKFKPLFRQLAFIIEGFYKWDLFQHSAAAQVFKRARIDDLATSEDQTICRFSKAVDRSVHKLKAILELSDSGRKLCRELILDLFANAERRAEEGKTDDAILRLYRLVEMLAQERLFNTYGIDTGNVRSEQLPEDLESEFRKQYEKDGHIKIPQAAAFRLLKALKDPLGEIFETAKKDFQKIQNARNFSYLAHGIQSGKEGTYSKLRSFVLSLNVFVVTDIPVFPKLVF